jgi:hypothetical protein
MTAGMKKLALIPVLAAVVYGGYLLQSHEAAHVDVRDRVWIDHMPKSDRDTINVFALLTQQPVGVFQATSSWRGNFEAFRYEKQGNEVRAVFPQNGDRERITVSECPCDVRGMDYCLEVSGSSRGVKKYYSRKEWIIETRDQVDGVLGKAFEASDAPM